MKIVTILGARPQFVKAAALSRELSLQKDAFQEIIVHTGQHFDKNMSDVFFQEMEIPMPKYNLNINGLTHGAMTGQMLEGIEKILIKERPDYVLVYGDTNSTIAGALSAKKIHIPVVHVEAGLRSYNMNMPEEVNRILTDRISDLLFCPTQVAVDNLIGEGYEDISCEVILTGDIMQDAALFYKKKSDDTSQVLSELKIINRPFVLATVHRAENTDSIERLQGIVSALNILAEDIDVIVPLHPRTAHVLKKESISLNFTTIDPVGYLDMLQLISNSRLVLTDSGGLQKEAYFFDKFCVTLRDETEWLELITNGFNILVGADTDRIISATELLIDKEFIKEGELYGGGKAAANMRLGLLNHHK